MAITRTAEAELPVSTLDGDGAAVAVTVPDGLTRFTRFENCVECGICISACPTMATDERFRGPAMLAALARAQAEATDPAHREHLLDLADGEHGVWRCHGAWERTTRCPQQVDPAAAIMRQRGAPVRRRLTRRAR